MTALWLSLVFAAAPPPAAGDGIGIAIDDFSLRDAKGQAHRLSDLRECKVIVVVFLGADCPLAKLYAPRLAKLARTYRKRGAAFLAIAPNRHDSVADLARYVRQHALPFPLLRDVGQVVADRFTARRSPEVFVLDRGRRIRYRGRIDDQYGVGVQKPKATRRDLVDAVEALLADRPVSVCVTQAPGCPISRAPRAAAAHSVTWSRDVAPIVQWRCQVCHRRGQSAPFALTSYREAAGWAQAMREVIEDGRMPPWSANPKHGKFANDPSLTPSEKDVVFRWIDAGCPEGDPKDLPPPAKFPSTWSIPGPDLVLSMPEAFTVPADGVIEYQFIRVDPGFKEDRWVKAAEILPGNRAVVHHCNIFLEPPGAKDSDDVSAVGKLGSYCLTMMAQGTPPMILPDGMAKRIPAGWTILFVMHYQAVGSVQKDQTRLALTFADAKDVKQEVATRLMFDPALRIPPRVSDHHVSQTWSVNRDVLLLSFFPHMHLRGKSFRYDLVHPDGREETLLDVPRFDFSWQHRYVLDTPRRITASSKLRCTAVYDNSADNPANPDPDAEVRAGIQSWDEMFNGYFDVALADEDLTKPVPWYTTVADVACRFALPPPFVVLACLIGVVYLGRKRIAQALQTKADD
jgi:peroxiredoxin